MTPKESCEKEIARAYKKFYLFCGSSDSDDLKDLLSVLCSAFEKLETLANEDYKWINIKCLDKYPLVTLTKKILANNSLI